MANLSKAPQLRDLGARNDDSVVLLPDTELCRLLEVLLTRLSICIGLLTCVKKNDLFRGLLVTAAHVDMGKSLHHYCDAMEFPQVVAPTMAAYSAWKEETRRMLGGR